ncbi:MAG: hypothetical protein WBM14_07255 [Terracidiphilus sp.]|jgi:vacuolar-type H+-ATPase subunit I/STV1
MSSRTIYLSRLIGLYCVLVVPSMIVRREATVDTVSALLHSQSTMFVLGFIAITAGLAMVLAHNLWSGGALTVVVTVVGWLTLIKGLLFLYLPSEAEAEFLLRWLRHPQLFYVCMAPSLLIGIYLTWAGFTAKSRS